MSRLQWMIIFFVLVGLDGSAFDTNAQFPPPVKEKEGIDLQLNIKYYKVANQDILLDLAKPKKGKGPFPAVVCVHGGAWRLGSKSDVRPWLTYLAENGYLAISVGYRLIPKDPWPAQIEDCKTAVRWLRANADKYQVNPDKIGCMGFSAGGHLVTLLGLTDKKAGWNGKDYSKFSSQVQCVVDYYGPTDLTYYGQDETSQQSVFKPMLGKFYKEDANVYKKASPLTYIHKKTPPFLIFHGTSDNLVPVDQSRKLKEELNKQGGVARYIELKDIGHGWGAEASKQTNPATMDFLKQNLKGQ